jgi:hypothetical protein
MHNHWKTTSYLESYVISRKLHHIWKVGIPIFATMCLACCAGHCDCGGLIFEKGYRMVGKKQWDAGTLVGVLTKVFFTISVDKPILYPNPCTVS